MPRKRHKAEEIVAKLRRVEVLSGQGLSMAAAFDFFGATFKIAVVASPDCTAVRFNTL